MATDKLEKLKWAYRCWVRQLERAEKGSGIEDYFAQQDLSFRLPQGFQEAGRTTISDGGLQVGAGKHTLKVKAPDAVKQEFGILIGKAVHRHQVACGGSEPWQGNWSWSRRSP
mgnify:CR=1 FL=1